MKRSVINQRNTVRIGGNGVKFVGQDLFMFSACIWAPGVGQNESSALGNAGSLLRGALGPHGFPSR